MFGVKKSSSQVIISNTKGFYKFLKRAIAHKENWSISEPTKDQKFLNIPFSEIVGKGFE
jgi:hypothetical protein